LMPASVMGRVKCNFPLLLALLLAGWALGKSLSVLAVMLLCCLLLTPMLPRQG